MSDRYNPVIPPEYMINMTQTTQHGDPIVPEITPRNAGSLGRSVTDSNEMGLSSLREVWRKGQSPLNTAQENTEMEVAHLTHLTRTGQVNPTEVSEREGGTKVVYGTMHRDDQVSSVAGMQVGGDPQTIDNALRVAGSSNMQPENPMDGARSMRVMHRQARGLSRDTAAAFTEMLKQKGGDAVNSLSDAPLAGMMVQNLGSTESGIPTVRGFGMTASTGGAVPPEFKALVARKMAQQRANVAEVYRRGSGAKFHPSQLNYQDAQAQGAQVRVPGRQAVSAKSVDKALNQIAKKKKIAKRNALRGLTMSPLGALSSSSKLLPQFSTSAVTTTTSTSTPETRKLNTKISELKNQIDALTKTMKDLSAQIDKITKELQSSAYNMTTAQRTTKENTIRKYKVAQADTGRQLDQLRAQLQTLQSQLQKEQSASATPASSSISTTTATAASAAKPVQMTVTENALAEQLAAVNRRRADLLKKKGRIIDKISQIETILSKQAGTMSPSKRESYQRTLNSYRAQLADVMNLDAGLKRQQQQLTERVQKEKQSQTMTTGAQAVIDPEVIEALEQEQISQNIQNGSSSTAYTSARSDASAILGKDEIDVVTDTPANTGASAGAGAQALVDDEPPTAHAETGTISDEPTGTTLPGMGNENTTSYVDENGQAQALPPGGASEQLPVSRSKKIGFGIGALVAAVAGAYLVARG